MSDTSTFSPRPRRETYVDIAKGMAIILLVCWHAIGDNLSINPLFTPIRMPVFFFAAGLFAAKSLSLPWGRFLRDKVGHLLWIYLLWCAIYFLALDVPAAYIRRDLGELTEHFTPFHAPRATLWFIYALSLAYLLAKVLKSFGSMRISFSAGIIVALAVYLWIGNTEIPSLQFIQKLARLWPFFLLGALLAPHMSNLMARWKFFGPPLLAGSLVLIYIARSQGYLEGNSFSLIAFGLAGSISLFLCSRLISEFRLGDLLATLGTSTIYVYLIHRIVLNYSVYILEMAGISNNTFILGILASGIIVGSYFLGRVLHRHGFAFLFSAPWVTQRAPSRP